METVKLNYDVEELDMAKKTITVDEVLEAIDAMEIEHLAQVKEAAGDKMESMKHLVVTQMREQLQKQMSIFNLSAADLGFGSPAKATRKATGGGTQRQMKGGPCKICNATTEPLHDARAHRSQDPKAPFTAEELEMRHMRVVETA